MYKNWFASYTTVHAVVSIIFLFIQPPFILSICILFIYLFNYIHVELYQHCIYHEIFPEG